MEQIGIIYRVTNQVNQKVYIGQTFKGLNRRRYEHLRKAKYKSDVYFHKALHAHGTDKFDWAVIDTAFTKQELDHKERLWIEFYQSFNSEFGYNQTFGGEGGLLTEVVLKKISQKKKGCVPWNKGIPWSTEIKEKISKSHLGHLPWNKGIPMTDEQKRKLSSVKKGKPSSFKGKHHSEEAKQKIGLKSKGRQTRKGAVLSEETKRKISESLLKRNRRELCVS